MEISQKQLEHIALLARLTLTTEQKKRFAAQLSQIFDFVEKLKNVDVSNVKPTSQVTGLTNVAREDRVEPSQSQDDLLSAMPDRLGRQLKVKAILEDEKSN